MGYLLSKNRMVIVRITWGLWNQMFQYAYIKALSLKNNSNFRLDIETFEHYKLHKYCLEFFNIQRKYCKISEVPFYKKFNSNNKYLEYLLVKIKCLAKKFNKNHYIEKQFNFDADFLNIKQGYVEGYFQTEKYFIEYEDDIRKDFTFAISPSPENEKIIEKINSCNAISIHIRRWDYISNDTTNRVHGTCDLNYYKQAIGLIKEKIDNPIFFFFSDDINWAKEHLKVSEKSYYIDRNNANTNYEDMRLMSLCKHNIIANSSFSWWWAWLNSNPKKIVIAPSKWFNDNSRSTSDIIPSTWKKI